MVKVLKLIKKGAFKYFKMAADKGNTDGMYYAGEILLNGNEIPADRKTADIYLRKSIERGNQKAKKKYSTLIKAGDTGQDSQDIKSIKSQADNGNARACFRYAQILQTGDGVQPNAREALRYYKIGANNGNVDSMCCIAQLLDSGAVGVPVNKKEAVKYYRRAAENGKAEAMFYYAAFLEKGVYVHKNKREALMYYKKSFDKGFDKGLFKYKQLMKEMHEKDSIQNEEESIESSFEEDSTITETDEESAMTETEEEQPKQKSKLKKL